MQKQEIYLTQWGDRLFLDTTDEKMLSVLGVKTMTPMVNIFNELVFPIGINECRCGKEAVWGRVASDERLTKFCKKCGIGGELVPEEAHAEAH